MLKKYKNENGERLYKLCTQKWVGYIFVNFTKSRKGGTHAYTAARAGRPSFIPFCFVFIPSRNIWLTFLIYTEYI